MTSAHKYSSRIKSLSVAVMLLSLPLAGTALPYYAAAEQAVVSTGNASYSKITAPVVKPVWSASVASVRNNLIPEARAAMAEDGKVFLIQPSGKLAALNAANGRKLWEYGSGLAPMFTYNKGYVYGITTSGALYAVNAAGQKSWSASISFPKADSVQYIAGTVYVTQEAKITAVDAATGKIKWKVQEDANNYTGSTSLLESSGILIRSYTVQGAISVPLIAAYDTKTGNKLWESSRQSFPLTIENGMVYSVANTDMLDDDPVNRKIKVSVINLKSGDLKGERVYRWTDTENKDGSFRSGGAYGSAFLDGNDLYVFQGKALVKYDFHKYEENGKPVQKWAQTQLEDQYPLYKVHQGRLFYRNNDTQGLSVMKLASGQYFSFNMGENPPAQTDVYGKGVYVGQTDGVFHAYDLATLKPVLTLNTGSREFAPTLKTGSMLIIQTGGKLLGIKLPASLQ